QVAVEAAGLEAELWDSEGSLAAPLMAFFDSFVYVIYAIFALVAGSGIANSVLLSVQDRTRDFGTLRAVAFGPGAVKAIVALETVIIGAAASLAAAAASWAFIAALGPEGLIIPETTRGITDWMPRSVAARVDPAALALILAGGIFLPLAAAAYPLHVLGKLKIREALGYI
ncbi:MAG: ABC transporter permease, partial [Spirochaetaceae bacterium]|nr:ABC transporter permease [Spirochaetaceae bacterium]